MRLSLPIISITILILIHQQSCSNLPGPSSHFPMPSRELFSSQETALGLRSLAALRTSSPHSKCQWNSSITRSTPKDRHSTAISSPTKASLLSKNTNTVLKAHLKLPLEKASALSTSLFESASTCSPMFVPANQSKALTLLTATWIS